MLMLRGHVMDARWVRDGCSYYSTLSRFQTLGVRRPRRAHNDWPRSCTCATTNDSLLLTLSCSQSLISYYNSCSKNNNNKNHIMKVQQYANNNYNTAFSKRPFVSNHHNNKRPGGNCNNHGREKHIQQGAGPKFRKRQVYKQQQQAGNKKTAK